jgi:hypothetical protein
MTLIPRALLTKVTATCFAVFGLLVGSQAAGAEQGVPALRQASILTRALAYDRNMKERAGDSISVGVLYRSGNAASESCANEILQGFKGLEKFAVHGLPFKAMRIAYDTGGSMKDLIRSEGVDALYACNGLDSEIDAIAALGQERKIITMGAREEYVKRALTIGVFTIDGAPSILINWGESQKEGASFSSDLVRLAKVINDAGR